MATKIHITYSPLEKDIALKLDTMFGITGSLIEVNPGKVLLPPKYSEIGERIRDLKVYKDDVWVVSLPRTGSTWAQEMIWLIANDLDYNKAKSVIQHVRAPLLELSAILVNGPTKIMEKLGDSVTMIENLPSPRFIKTHLPKHLLPTDLDTVKPKLVYVARNPKDMCVSYYHYCKLIHNLHSTFEEFCDLFINDLTPLGSIWNHILGFWALRNEPNFMFIKYEDMKRDLPEYIRKCAKFFDKSVTDEQVQVLADYLSFQNMKKNPAVNLEQFMEAAEDKDLMKRKGIDFIRKGEIGDYKNFMSDDLSHKFDVWIEKNLKGTCLNFD